MLGSYFACHCSQHRFQLYSLLFFQARSDILRESYKNEGTELLLLNSGGNSGSGISSQSRRVIPTSEFAQGSLNETSNGASGALVLFNSGKETVYEESEVQATLENGKRSRSPETDEDDKNEPKDLLTAMDSFDNLFCRRCLVRALPLLLLPSSVISLNLCSRRELNFNSTAALLLQVFDCRLHGCSQAIVHPVSRRFCSVLS